MDHPARLFVPLVAALATSAACTADSPSSPASQTMVALPELSDTEATVVEWLRERAHPIGGQYGYEAFRTVYGDTRLLGVGEENHGEAEPAVIRNRAFTLGRTPAEAVEADGATGPRWRAVTLESGAVEARLVDIWVHDRTSTKPLEEVLAFGFTHGFGLFEETKELVEWVRDYNSLALAKTPAQPTIHVVGKDLTRDGDLLRIPLAHVRSYLDWALPGRSDLAQWSSTLLARQARPMDVALDAFRRLDREQRAAGGEGLPHPIAVDPDFLDVLTSLGWESLAGYERAELRGDVTRLIAQLRAADTRDALLSAPPRHANLSSEDEYEFALHMAEFAAQTIRNLDNRIEHPADPKAKTAVALLAKEYAALGETLPPVNEARLVDETPEAAADYFLGRRTRELALAENNHWAVNRYGSLFNYAHNGHLKRKDDGTLVGETLVENFAEGEFLARALGDEYVMIASTTLEYAPGERHGFPVPSLAQCGGCIERLLARAGDDTEATGYLVDLRIQPGEVVPVEVTDWLNTPAPTRFAGQFRSVILANSYDALFWYRTSTEAKPFPAPATTR